ncbi:ornithine cyclodeaminase [Acidovorax sp. HDW3]|uniref:ornithine cyclodeaminase n=1 Tax=Acidovorax sp. HDW3 TaxID=2714923 RepID=UPI00140D97E0|nr:ornithine cyclodeaminase [Acidovorax sp. HDW3]QIL43025.1 ornithine cyclodeaminase [Acidovorax sp. HDW3]
MTRLLDLPTLAQLVRNVGPADFLRQLAAQIEADFQRWPAFEKNARLAHHCAQGVIELMPISDGARYSFKFVNGHPGNPAQGLPTVMAFGVLADMATGTPLLLAEATLLTALRTAATSALAARVLARPDSRCMALIGNGAQGEFQALAFHTLLGITQLRLYDPDPQASAKLQRNLAALGLPVHITLAASIDEAIAGADIITTATAAKAHAALFGTAQLTPGQHLNAIGGDCPGKTELPPEVLRAARIFVEYAPQTRIEGEIQQLPAEHPVTELWQVLSGQAPGRQSAADITLFDSVGFALEDHAALCLVQRLAQEWQLGHDIALVPSAGGPKDLFRALR